jgi:hypothetical protein
MTSRFQTTLLASHIVNGGKEAETLKQEEDLRLKGAVTRGREIEIVVDRHPVRAYEGETVAAALMAAGQRALRTTPRRGEPRGLYCGMGVCFECVMTVDERPNIRTCQTCVHAGMRVQTQRGDGSWGEVPEEGKKNGV